MELATHPSNTFRPQFVLCPVVAVGLPVTERLPKGKCGEDAGEAARRGGEIIRCQVAVAVRNGDFRIGVIMSVLDQIVLLKRQFC